MVFSSFDEAAPPMVFIPAVASTPFHDQSFRPLTPLPWQGQSSITQFMDAEVGLAWANDPWPKSNPRLGHPPARNFLEPAAPRRRRNPLQRPCLAEERRLANAANVANAVFRQVAVPPRRDGAVLLWPGLFATDSLALDASGKGVWRATARPERAFEIIEGPRRPSLTNREENRLAFPQLRWRRSLSLAEPGRLAGGMEYAAVAQAPSRFGRRMERTPELRQKIATVQKQM